MRESSSLIARASTASVGDADKFAYFCDAICGVYSGIQPERSTDRQFDAEFTAHALGDTVLATITAPGHAATRNRAMISARPDPHLFLNFSTQSTFKVSHVGRDWRRPPSTPFLLDNNEAFTLDFDPSRRMRLHSLRIVNDSSGKTLTAGAIRHVNERIASTTTGRQLALQMRLLCQVAESGNTKVAALMSRPVLGLLSALLTDDDEAGDGGDLSDMKSVARLHLADPDFGVESLAGIFRCSARTVQSRFAQVGETLSTWLLAERLESARELIQSPAYSGRSIDTIARVTGFRDASHFHRAFKARFSASPGYYRPRPAVACGAGGGSATPLPADPQASAW